jgi:hypothetical protein
MHLCEVGVVMVAGAAFMGSTSCISGPVMHLHEVGVVVVVAGAVFMQSTSCVSGPVLHLSPGMPPYILILRLQQLSN